MTNLTTRESHPLTAYKAQGLGHIFTLAGLVTAGTYMVSLGGAPVYAVPFATVACYQLFKSAGKTKDASWCKSRDELWGYRLSPKHKSIASSYDVWCKEWGTDAINGLIDPMIGNCELCNFTKDKSHPYHKLRGILTYDDGELKPLTPHEYVSQRLSERVKALEKDGIQTIEATVIQALPESLTAAVSLPSDGLKDRLFRDCPELLKLVMGKPIRVSAEQRTGKSSFVRKLVLIRQLLIPGHKVTWCTPHLEKDDRLPIELNPIGYTASGGKDMAAIEACWIATQKDINAGKQLNQTVVWDEFGDYAEFEKPEVLAQSLLSLLRESKKKEYYPILITHGDQAAFYPGVKNILTTLKQGTVRVETIGEVVDVFGNIRPTGKFRVYEQDSENFKESQLPEWLTEEYLLEQYQKLPQTVDAIAQPTQTYPVEYQTPTQIYPVEYKPLVKQKLEDTFRIGEIEIKEVEAIPDPVELLKEPLNEIARYIISRGGEVDVRSLKAWGRSRKNGALLSGEIQDYLLEMMEMSLIEIFTHDDKKTEHIKWLSAKLRNCEVRNG